MTIFIMTWNDIGTTVCKYGETYSKICQEYPDAKITEVNEATDLSELRDGEFHALYTKYKDDPQYRKAITLEAKRRWTPLYKSMAPDSGMAIENALKVIRLNGCFRANNHNHSFPVIGRKDMVWDSIDIRCTLNDNNDMEIEIFHTNECGCTIPGGRRVYCLHLNNSHWELMRIGRDEEFPVAAPKLHGVSPWLNEVDFILCVFGTEVLVTSEDTVAV